MERNQGLLVAIIVIILVLLLARNVSTDVFVDDYGTDYGAVLVLNFEEGIGTTAFDQSPYGNDGIITGASWADGKFGEALTFDGNDYVTVSDSASLGISDYITIEAWAKDPPIPFGAELGGNFSITENTVWINNTHVYLSAEPHTISSSGWVNFMITNKNGNIPMSVLWGFNASEVKPSRPQIWENYTHTLWRWVETEESYFNESTGETYNYTGHEKEYYNSTFFDWKDIDVGNGEKYSFTIKNVSAMDMNVWYNLKGVHINAGDTLKIRSWVELPFAGQDVVRGKYVLGVKPGSLNINQIDKFYFLDPWYDSSWLYRTKITVDSGDVDEALTNFTAMVYLNSSRIDWAHVQDDLDDLRFTTDDEVTLLSYEIDSYTTNDEAWLWVRLPIVSNITDTDFYMYYGNAGASSGDDMEGTWDPSAVMVLHFKEGTGDTVEDSTIYSNDGIIDGASWVEGYIGSGLSFDSDYVDVAHNDVLNLTTGFTLMSRGKIAETESQQWMISKRGIIDGDTGYFLGLRSDKIYGGYYQSGVGWKTIDGLKVLSDDTWYDYGVTWDGVTMKTYVDGVFDKSLVTGGTVETNADILMFGTFKRTSYWVVGILDEIYISSTARTPAWIKANYETGRDHLLTFGAEIYEVDKVIVEKEDAYALGISEISLLVGMINSTYVTYTIPTVTDWHYYAMTYDDTTLKLYMDGTLVDSTALTGMIATNANDVIIGDRWVGEIDQLRIYNVPKTLGEIKNHYINTGGMYSGSVIVSDDFRILNTTLGEIISVSEEGLDMNLHYLLYMPFETWIHHDTIGGADREHVLDIPAGSSTQDRYYYKVVMKIDQPPGVGKNVNMTMTDGTNSMTIIISGTVDVTGSTTVGAFTLDVSAEDLTIEQTQTGGGAAEQCSILIYWYYVETP